MTVTRRCLRLTGRPGLHWAAAPLPGPGPGQPRRTRQLALPAPAGRLSPVGGNRDFRRKAAGAAAAAAAFKFTARATDGITIGMTATKSNRRILRDSEGPDSAAARAASELRARGPRPTRNLLPGPAADSRRTQLVPGTARAIKSGPVPYSQPFPSLCGNFSERSPHRARALKPTGSSDSDDQELETF
jgi:hypothetical protein